MAPLQLTAESAHPRVNPRRLPAVKVAAGTSWTLAELRVAFGVDTDVELEQLLGATQFSGEVRASNLATAGLGNYAHPGRLWLRGYTTVRTPRSGTIAVVRTYAESMAMIDLRHRGPRSRAGRLEAQTLARAEALNAARDSGLDAFLLALNTPLRG